MMHENWLHLGVLGWGLPQFKDQCGGSNAPWEYTSEKCVFTCTILMKADFSNRDTVYATPLAFRRKQKESGSEFVRP